ncbi:LbetaH domain-containing protein [Hymenobacter psychrophilus]|uniref:Serine O-acetyltransferase n=1 Tax=Hymenobacter psychrophilus TaxID=651662 RepID=A0A1H3JJQ6_9BACT|nr:hypothetical protein [Hymenobacter psychrophilus]SDY39648.1 serine O-acetyltransferase [Hymenobacter psychrophilus]
MRIQLALPEMELTRLLQRQLTALFVFNSPAEDEALQAGCAYAQERVAYSFQFHRNKYYRRDGAVYFSPFQSSQYAIFLYYAAYYLGQQAATESLADRVYYLNKALNGVDLYHQTVLPAVFGLDHPVGSVMGRAEYGNYFSFMQGCTVGQNNGLSPRIGENVCLMAYAGVLGNSHIGDNCILGAQALVIDEHIPANSHVFGRSPHLIVRTKTAEIMRVRSERWWFATE